MTSLFIYPKGYIWVVRSGKENSIFFSLTRSPYIINRSVDMKKFARIKNKLRFTFYSSFSFLYLP